MSANSFPPSSGQLDKFKNVPAATPPPGVVPNFAARNQVADIYHILCSILLVMVYVFFGLRMYAKFWIKRTPGLEDLACILATIGLSAQFGLAVAMTLHGVGKHQWDVPPSELPVIIRLGKDISIIYPPSMLSLKLSLLLLYLRVFAIHRLTRYLTYVGMAICFLGYTVLMFLDIFANIQMIIDTNKALGAVNFSTDIYILCVPIAAVSKLQLSAKNRLGLISVFMTGVVACAMGLAGLIFRLQVHGPEADSTYALAGTLIVTTIEGQVGLMCACMPFFPAVVGNSPTLQKCVRSVQSLGSVWTLKSSPGSPVTDAGRGYRKHGSRDGSGDGLELHGRRESSAGGTLVGSSDGTARTERGGSEGYDGRPESSWTKV